MARTLRPFAVLGAALAVVLLGAAPAQAHPLGNFSVNTYSELVVTPDRVQVSVVVDRAEIPTRQDFPELDDRTGTLPGGTDAAAGEQCGTVAAGVALTVDGRRAALGVTDSALTFPPGAAGLRTARLVCVLHSEGSVPVVGTRVDYRLSPVSPAAGWRETTAVGDGVRLTGSSVPERSLSDALRAYPEDRLASPLDVSTASFDVAAGTGVASGVSSVLGDAADAILPRGADRVTQAFTALVDRDRLTVPFAVFAVLVAALLGGLHAFAPGHGKTVMAACLVGRRGTVRDAVLLGGAVTVTHTAGVLVLGLVLSVLGLAQPQRAYPVLATASGLLLVGIGVVLLRSARRRAAVVPVRVAAPRPVLVAAGDAPAREQHHGHGNRDHDDHHAHDHDAHDHHAHDHDHHDHDHHDHDHHAHDHDHDHDHDHHGEHDHHDHDHDHHGAGTTTHAHGFGTHTHVVPSAGGGWRSLVAVGLAGGMVPSPSALIVLLGGIALGRAWFGLTLVVAYGLGMAVALAGTGLLLVQARGRLDRVLATAADGPVLRASRRAAAALPTATAGLVLVVGALLTVRAVAQL